MVVGLREKMDSSLSTAVTSQLNTSGPVLEGQINLSRELDVVRKGMEWSEKLIPSDYVDIALNRKCNTIDLPVLQSASKTCEKSLLKYLLLPDIDNSYRDQISDLLDMAESWALSMVQAYTNAVMHSIKGSPGEVTDVGIDR